MTNATTTKKPAAKQLITVAKFAIVIGALAYLIYSEKLSLKNLVINPGHWDFVAIGAALLMTTVSLSFFRYWFLLKGVGINISVPEAMRIGVIGAFFNTFMLGSMGGDIVKLAYVIKHSGKKAGAFASIMVDRVFGLMGLLILGGGALIISWSEVLSTQTLHALVVGVFGTLGVVLFSAFTSFMTLAKGRRAGIIFWLVVVGISTFFGYSAFEDQQIIFISEVGVTDVNPGAQALLRGFLILGFIVSCIAALLCIIIVPSCQPGRKFEGFIRNRIPGGNSIMALIQSLLAYRGHFSSLAAALALSVILQVINIIAIYYFSKAMVFDPAPQLEHIFFAAPPTFVANALPVPMGGLGVGESVFESILMLCRSTDGREIVGGANLFLFYRFWLIATGLVGLPFYLKGKKEIVKAEKEYLKESDNSQ